jgi:hypothetical protein
MQTGNFFIFFVGSLRMTHLPQNREVRLGVKMLAKR